jgi:hypothetical protein
VCSSDLSIIPLAFGKFTPFFPAKFIHFLVPFFSSGKIFDSKDFFIVIDESTNNTVGAGMIV